MKCSRCQAQNREGVRFCEDCGARLEVTCPNCGAAVVPNKKFCGSCGAPLAAQPADRFASPQAYTPKHLAEKILTSKSALEGERKQVTVLFADVSGFTSLSERLDPEDVHQLMARAFEQMLAAAKRMGQARETYHAAREVIDGIKANLRDPELRASLETSPLIRQVYDVIVPS